MEQFVSETFSQYAYSPMLVYGAICFFMLLSAFGMPIPEEVILISSGLVGYMSLHPDQFPPPYPDAPRVNIYVLATVAFFAVIFSDYLIYYIGRSMGPKLFKTRWFSRLVSTAALERIQRWMWAYGSWAVVIFRFTPGVRFPGHLSCGAMGLSPWRFIAVDWAAAGISVPTQVLLVAIYGEFILSYFREFKIVLLSVIAIGVTIFLVTKFMQQRRAQPLAGGAAASPNPRTATPPPTEPS